MAKWITAKNHGWSVPWLLVVAIGGGCADGPRKVDDGWEGDVLGEEAEDAPRDVESAVAPQGEESPETHHEADKVDASAMPAEQEGGSTEEQMPAKPAPRDAAAPVGTEMDGGDVSETDDAGADESTGSAMPDASVGDDASTPAEDAAYPADPCDPNPCEHGTCTAGAGVHTCTCADGYLGQRCDQKVCDEVAIQSRADVEDNRDCREIRGNLTISSLGLTSITADDFPFLKRIKGDLVISGQHATSEQPHLDTITLRNLRAVDGALVVVGVALAGVGGSGPLNELHLPALERVGAHDGIGLALFQANLRVLDLPALRWIEGSAMLESLLELCSVRLDALERVGGSVALLAVPRLQPSEFEPLRAAAAGAVNEQQLGCCAASEDEQVACEGFTESARSLSCTGCGGTVVKTAG